MQLNLNFHNHTILVSLTKEAILEKLKDEFHFFVSDEINNPDSKIDLHFDTPPEIPSLVCFKLTETCAIYELGHCRYIDYFGKALTIWDKLENKVEIFSLDENRLYELAFLAIHSLLGQYLDQDGLCRIHALGVSLSKINALVMLPSKGGKSSLLTQLLQNPEIKIISDDMPLINYKGEVFPFPSKISLDKIPEDGPLSKLNWNLFNRAHYPPKFTASLGQLKERSDKESHTNSTLLIAGFRLSKGQSLLTPVSRLQMIKPLCEHMVIGFGLPQVLEMFLSFGLKDLFRLAYIGFLRSVCAFRLLMKSECYHFYMGPDISYNSQLILDQLYERQPS